MCATSAATCSRICVPEISSREGNICFLAQRYASTIQISPPPACPNGLGEANQSQEGGKDISGVAAAGTIPGLDPLPAYCPPLALTYLSRSCSSSRRHVVSAAHCLWWWSGCIEWRVVFCNGHKGTCAARKVILAVQGPIRMGPKKDLGWFSMEEY